MIPRFPWGRLEKRRMATESGGDETGYPGDETGDNTGDDRDGGDWWGNVGWYRR